MRGLPRTSRAGSLVTWGGLKASISRRGPKCLSARLFADLDPFLRVGTGFATSRAAPSLSFLLARVRPDARGQDILHGDPAKESRGLATRAQNASLTSERPSPLETTVDPRSSITCLSGPSVPYERREGEVQGTDRAGSCAGSSDRPGSFCREEIDRLAPGPRMVGAPVSSFVPVHSSRPLSSCRSAAPSGRSQECFRGLGAFLGKNASLIPSLVPMGTVRNRGLSTCDLRAGALGQGDSLAASSAEVVKEKRTPAVGLLEWAPESGSKSGSNHPRKKRAS